MSDKNVSLFEHCIDRERETKVYQDHATQWVYVHKAFNGKTISVRRMPPNNHNGILNARINDGCAHARAFRDGRED